MRVQSVDAFHVGAMRCTPCVAPDDKLIVAGTAAGPLVLFDLTDGSVVRQLSAHTSPVTCVAWNTRGEDHAVSVGSVDKAGDVVFWGAASKRTQGAAWS